MPFYATKQKSLEKSSAFAKRLLDNSPALAKFQYRKQAEKLLTATIDRFPELFLKKAMRFPSTKPYNICSLTCLLITKMIRTSPMTLHTSGIYSRGSIFQKKTPL